MSSLPLDYWCDLDELADLVPVDDDTNQPDVSNTDTYPHPALVEEMTEAEALRYARKVLARAELISLLKQ
jgi:hypothetical protein